MKYKRSLAIVGLLKKEEESNGMSPNGIPPTRKLPCRAWTWRWMLRRRTVLNGRWNSKVRIFQVKILSPELPKLWLVSECEVSWVQLGRRGVSTTSFGGYFCRFHGVRLIIEVERYHRGYPFPSPL